MDYDDIRTITASASRLKQDGRYVDALAVRLDLERQLDVELRFAEQKAFNLNFIAYLNYYLGDLDEAERAARKCVDVYQLVATEHDQTLATYFMMLACVLAMKREFDEAARWGDRAVELFTGFLGKENEFACAAKRDVAQMRAGNPGPYLSRD